VLDKQIGSLAVVLDVTMVERAGFARTKAHCRHREEDPSLGLGDCGKDASEVGFGKNVRHMLGDFDLRQVGTGADLSALLKPSEEGRERTEHVPARLGRELSALGAVLPSGGTSDLDVQSHQDAQ
jgi:hypothetical protein